MSGTSKWEADQMLNAYILDYLRKKGLEKSANLFQKEAQVPVDPVLISAPGGFLLEWWSVFWDVFSARTKKTSSPDAKAYVDMQRQRGSTVGWQPRQPFNGNPPFMADQVPGRRDGPGGPGTGMPPGVPYGVPPSNRMPGMLDPTTGAPTGPNPGSFSMGPGGPGGMPMQGGGAPGGPSNMNPGGMPGHRTSASGPIPGAPGSPWAGSGQFPGGPGGPGPSGNPNAPTFFNPNEMNMGPGGPMGGNPQGMPQRGGPMPGGAPGGPSGAPGGPVPGPYQPQGMAGMPKGPATRMQKRSSKDFSNMPGAPGGIPSSPNPGGMPNPGQPMNVTPASPHGNAGGPVPSSMTGNPNMPHEIFGMQGNQQLPQPSNFPPGPPNKGWPKQPTTQPPSRDGPGMAQEGGWGMNNPQAGNVPGGNPQDMGGHQGQPGRSNLRASRGPAPGASSNMGPGPSGPGGMMPYPGMPNPSQQMPGGPGMPPGGSPGMPTHPSHGGSGPGPYGMRMPGYPPKGAPGMPGGQPKFSPYMGHENMSSPNAMGSAPNTPNTPGTMSASNPEMFQPTSDSNGSNPSANQGGPVTRIRMNTGGGQPNPAGAPAQPGAGPMDQSGPSTPTGGSGGAVKGGNQPRRPVRGSSGPIPGGPMPGQGMSPSGAPAGPLSGGPMPVQPTAGQPPQQGMAAPGYMPGRPSAEEYAKMTGQMGGPRPGGPGQPMPSGRPMYMPGQPPNGQRFMPAMGMPPGMNPMGGPMPGMPKGQMSNGMEYGYYNPGMGGQMMMPNDVDMKPASESDVSSFLEMGNDDSNKNENLLDSLLETGDDNYSVQTEQESKLEELGSITYPHKILASHFNLDGSLLATAGSDKKVTIWNVEAREPAMTFEGHTYSVVDVRFSPIITKYVASCAQDQTIRIWDTDSKSIQWTLKMPAIQGDNQTFNATSIDFHPRQPYLMASSDSGGILRFWNLQEQNSSSWIEGAAKKTARFQSLSGDTVAAGYDTLVKILDVTTERELRTIGDAHDKPINAITWSPNGDKLVTISDDVVKVWDASNNNFEHIKTTKLPRKLQACVYTNENKIYIGGYMQIHVWDFMHSDKPVAVKAHETSLSSLSYGKDLLASTCLNGSIKFWKATDNKL
jgi:hypothetical protein